MPCEIVTCSNGHKFPVNREKHKNCNYVICPHKGCHERVKIRKRFKFVPDVNWPKIKEERREDLREMKVKRKQGTAPAQIFPEVHAARVQAGLLAASMAMMKKEKEAVDMKAKEEKEK